MLLKRVSDLRIIADDALVVRFVVVIFWEEKKLLMLGNIQQIAKMSV